MSSLISLAVLIFSIVCMWFIFTKAHEPGWKSLIPIYNSYTMAKIAKCKWTFWVKFIFGGIASLITLGLTALFVTTFLATMSDFGAFDPEYYSPYEESPSEYDPYKDYFEYFEDMPEYTDPVEDNDYNITDISYTAATTEITPDMEAELEAAIDEFLTESEDIIGFLLILVLIPFFFAIPCLVATIVQYVKLSQVFGLHGAYALGLLFAKPVCMGILAFAPDVKYVGDGGYTPQYNPPQAPPQDYSQYNYAPVDSTVATSFTQPQQPAPNQSPAAGCSEPSRLSKEPIPQNKFVCPGCGVEFDTTPAPDTFCPNCGRLHR